MVCRKTDSTGLIIISNRTIQTQKMKRRRNIREGGALDGNLSHLGEDQ